MSKLSPEFSSVDFTLSLVSHSFVTTAWFVNSASLDASSSFSTSLSLDGSFSLLVSLSLVTSVPLLITASLFSATTTAKRIKTQNPTTYWY